MNSNRNEALDKILTSCQKCQHCSSGCELLRRLGSLTPLDVADQVLKEQVSLDAINYIMRCALCGLCVQNCPNKLDIPSMVIAARHILLNKGVTNPEIFRIMWIDHDWNAITLYRDTYQVGLSHLIKDRCDTLFFPGCSLINRSPTIVDNAVNWLSGQALGKVGITLMCCGFPLLEMGLLDRAAKYTDLLWQKVRNLDARKLVTACPACHSYLLNHRPADDVEIISVLELMANAGVKAPVLGDRRITIHDSCPTRDGVMGKWARTMLSNHEIIEMEHHEANTICCGSGGVISMVDRELHDNRARTRLKEFYNTECDTCVTYCMACSNTLTSVAQHGAVRHILELVFNQMVDHDEYAANIRAMWEGEWGQYNDYRLQSSCLINENTIGQQ